jgi:hypothetical protein
MLQPGQIHAQHLPIQEQECVECLPVGSWCHLLLGCKHGQKAFNVSLPHLTRVSKSVMVAGCTQHKRLGPADKP